MMLELPAREWKYVQYRPSNKYLILPALKTLPYPISTPMFLHLSKSSGSVIAEYMLLQGYGNITFPYPW